MSIKLQCVCKKVLTLPDNLTGQKVRCKDCGKVMTVPAPAQTNAPARRSSSAFEVQGHRLCSGCGKSYPLTNKVCVACGVNMDTGAQLYVSLDEQGQAEAAAKAKADAEAAPQKKGFVARILGLLGRRKSS